MVIPRTDLHPSAQRWLLGRQVTDDLLAVQLDRDQVGIASDLQFVVRCRIKVALPVLLDNAALIPEFVMARSRQAQPIGGSHDIAVKVVLFPDPQGNEVAIGGVLLGGQVESKAQPDAVVFPVIVTDREVRRAGIFPIQGPLRFCDLLDQLAAGHFKSPAKICGVARSTAPVG